MARGKGDGLGPVTSRRRFLGGGLAGAASLVVSGAAASGCGQATASRRRTRPLTPPGAPVVLQTDGMDAPIGLGVDDVFFSWRVGDSRRGALQRAYRLVVSRVPTGPAAPAHQVWDSGRVASPQQAFVPYAGPALAPDTVYRWTVRTWAASGDHGPSSAPATFETALRERDWRASWIARKVPAAQELDEYTYARTEIQLADAPVVRARAYVSGDQQYEMYVNGVRAGKGQAYSFPDSQYYETLDVTALLRPGTANAFGLLYNWQGATKGHPAGKPGVIAQVSITHADGTHRLVTTDGTWRVLAGAWLPGRQRDLEGDKVDFTENIDGPAIPVGWESPGFDAGAWAPAAVLGPAGTAPWRHLVSVRNRIAEKPVSAVTLTTLASGSVVADFGKVYAAVPTVAFGHGVAGHTVPMHAGYLLDEPGAGLPPGGVPGQVSTIHGTQHTDMSYSYVQRGGTEAFHPFDYLGFRYLQIDDPGEVLTPAAVVAMTRHTVVPDEHAATFSSSIPTLDAVFELARHSALFTAQEQFVDTPTREKGPWLWDGFNESKTAMAAFGEQNLTRRALAEFAQSQRRYWRNGAVNKIYPTGLGAEDINEYTLIYPEWVWQYWMHSGDRALLEQVYPVLVNICRYVADSIDSTGLVNDLPSTNIYYKYFVVTRLNVLGANVFHRTADVAAALRRPASEIQRQRQRHAALVAAVNRHLTRRDGTYADGLDGSGGLLRRASQTANACALAYGAVPARQRATVAAHVAGLGMATEVWTANEVLRALASVGRTDDVVRLMTDSAIDGWARILARGGTFTWEVWEPSDAAGDSLSHGWGSDVLVEMQRTLLGVTPTAPGFAAFAVAPPRTGLASAAGTVPTVRGPVAVSWTRPHARAAAGEEFTLELSVPPNAVASVRLPVAAGSSVTESGRAVRHAAGVRVTSAAGEVPTMAVGAGSYRFRAV